MRVVSRVCRPHRTMAVDFSFESVKAAYDRIKDKVKHTPIMTCSEMDKQTRKEIFLKCEHLQATGSFKVRGALNVITRLMETNPDCKGVTTDSSGNHGLGLSWAARQLEIPCTIVLPEGAPACKVEAIRSYGAEVALCESTPEGRKATLSRIVEETGFFSCTHDLPDVVAGQGTIAIELLEQVRDLEAIVCTVSQGAMPAGICIAAKAFNPSIRIFIATPKGKMLEECMRSGERLWPNPPQFLDTLADGVKYQQLGHNTFPIVCKYAEKDIIEVSDAEIIEAMKFCFHRMKQVIEPAAGVPLAACFTEKFKQLPDLKRVAVVLCGGNVDINNLPWTSDYKQPY